MRGTKFSVIGMGKYGRSIAQILSDRGAEVIAIDNREEYIEEVEDIVALAVTMDATDGKALESQNIHESDAVVVAIGANFEALLIPSQIPELYFVNVYSIPSFSRNSKVPSFPSLT